MRKFSGAASLKSSKKFSDSGSMVIKFNNSHSDSIKSGKAGEKEIFGTLLKPSVSAK